MLNKNLLLKTMLLLCALMAGSGSVWADDVTTYTFTSKSWAATCDNGSANWTSGKDGNQFTSGQGVQITTGVSGANATSPISFTNVKSIEVKYCTNASKGVGTIKVKVGDGTEKSFSVNAPSSGGTTLKTTEFTFNPTETGFVKLTVNSTTNSIYIYSIAITTVNSSLDDCDLALTNAPVALNFDLYNNSAAQTVNYTTSSIGTVSIANSAYATFSVDQTNKTITVTPTAVTPNAQTITVTQEADATYDAGSVTFTISVSDSNPDVPGTVNNPYTVEQAISNTPSSGTSDNVYICGVVSRFQNTDIISDGSNYRYYIKDKNKNNELLVYKGKGLNNIAFSKADDLLVGDEVVILGGLTTYNSTKEVAQNNYIVSLTRPASIIVESTTINVDAEGETDEVEVNANSIDTSIGLDVVFYESDGITTTTYSWVTASINASGNLEYLVEENENSAARTAYLKVYGLDSDGDDVYSDLITITQAAAQSSLTLDKAYMVSDWTDFSGSYITTPTEKTVNGVIFTVNQVCKQTDLQLKANAGEMTSQTIKSTNGYTVIIVTGSGSNNSGMLTVQIGNDVAQTVTGPSSTLSVTTTNTSAKFTVKNLNNGVMRIESITIIPIVNAPVVQSYGWASYIAAQDVEFAAGTAYVVTDASVANGLTLEEVSNVPTGTPVLLKGVGTKSVTVLSATPAAPSINLLSIGTGSVASGSYAYVLAKNDEGACFKQWKGDADVLNGRVVLLLDEQVAAARQFFTLYDDATGVEATLVNKAKENGVVYNLQGQRVVQPAKGLYIINGKKVMK